MNDTDKLLHGVMEWLHWEVSQAWLQRMHEAVPGLAQWWEPHLKKVLCKREIENLERQLDQKLEDAEKIQKQLLEYRKVVNGE